MKTEERKGRGPVKIKFFFIKQETVDVVLNYKDVVAKSVTSGLLSLACAESHT